MASVGLLAFMLATPAAGHVGGTVRHLFEDHIQPRLAYQRVIKNITVPAHAARSRVVLCPRGSEVLGGGATVIRAGEGPFNTVLQESGPGTVGASRNLWGASIRNNEAVAHRVRFYAVCANVRS